MVPQVRPGGVVGFYAWLTDCACQVELKRTSVIRGVTLQLLEWVQSVLLCYLLDVFMIIWLCGIITSSGDAEILCGCFIMTSDLLKLSLFVHHIVQMMLKFLNNKINSSYVQEGCSQWFVCTTAWCFSTSWRPEKLTCIAYILIIITFINYYMRYFSYWWLLFAV